MADIYTSKAISPQYRSSFRASEVQYDDKSKELQQMAMKEKQEADEIYSLSVNNAAKMNMNELFTQYSADPKALSEELKKLGSKISDEMPNDEMKVNFLSNYMLNSSSLINKAQANFDRIQEQKRKSAIFDSIQNNIKQMELAFSNGLNGTGSIDDFVNYQQAANKNKSLINARNKDGTYMFSDAQRLAMGNDIDKTSIKAFTSSLLEMSDSDRKNIIDRLNEDKVVIMDSEGKQINLKDAVDATVYKDMKKSALVADNKLKKQAIQEWNANKAYSQIQLFTEPNEQNYKTWEYYHQDASDDKKQAMQKIANYVPDEEVETNFTGITDVEDALSKLSNMPLDTEEDRVNMLDNIADFVLELNKANERGDISADDVKKQANLAYNMYNNKAFQEQVQTIYGQPSTFNKIATSLIGGFRNRKVIESIGLETTQNTVQALLNNDPETALEIYKDGVQKAIRMRYPEIPFQSMKEGDIFWYEPTGKAYKFLGYGVDDILVEVDPNTGVRK